MKNVWCITERRQWTERIQLGSLVHNYSKRRGGEDGIVEQREGWNEERKEGRRERERKSEMEEGGGLEAEHVRISAPQHDSQTAKDTYFTVYTSIYQLKVDKR